MIYTTLKDVHEGELRQYGFNREDTQNICSKIGDFYVVLYTEDELKDMKEDKEHE